MNKRGLSRSLRSLPSHEELLDLPLGEALSRVGVLRVEVSRDMPTWLVASSREKRALAHRGAPAASVWTLRELESFPWTERPVSLGHCIRAFRSWAQLHPTKENRHD